MIAVLIQLALLLVASASCVAYRRSQGRWALRFQLLGLACALGSSVVPVLVVLLEKQL